MRAEKRSALPSVRGRTGPVLPVLDQRVPGCLARRRSPSRWADPGRRAARPRISWARGSGDCAARDADRGDSPSRRRAPRRRRAGSRRRRRRGLTPSRAPRGSANRGASDARRRAARHRLDPAELRRRRCPAARRAAPSGGSSAAAATAARCRELLVEAGLDVVTESDQATLVVVSGRAATRPRSSPRRATAASWCARCRGPASCARRAATGRATATSTDS